MLLRSLGSLCKLSCIIIISFVLCITVYVHIYMGIAQACPNNNYACVHKTCVPKCNFVQVPVQWVHICGVNVYLSV